MSARLRRPLIYQYGSVTFPGHWVAVWFAEKLLVDWVDDAAPVCDVVVMSQSNDRESNATFRVRYVDGQTATYAGAVFVGIRDGHVGIETGSTSPRKHDGALWTETVLKESHWLPVERVERLDVEHGPSEAVSGRVDSRDDEAAPGERGQVEARVLTHVDHILTSLLEPGEVDEWHFEWTGGDAESAGGGILWATLTVQGERFSSVVWDPHPDLLLEDHLDEFVEGFENFISESRFAWGQQRLLADRPWHPEGWSTEPM